MDSVVSVGSFIIQLFQLPITIFEFTISLWQVMLFTLVAGILMELIGGLLHG